MGNTHSQWANTIHSSGDQDRRIKQKKEENSLVLSFGMGCVFFCCWSWSWDSSFFSLWVLELALMKSHDFWAFNLTLGPAPLHQLWGWWLLRLIYAIDLSNSSGCSWPWWNISSSVIIWSCDSLSLCLCLSHSLYVFVSPFLYLLDK